MKPEDVPVTDEPKLSPEMQAYQKQLLSEQHSFVEEEFEGEMVSGVVARGRTVSIPVAFKQEFNSEGGALVNSATREYSQGMMVVLPKAEMNELKKAGFIVDPEKLYIEPTTGPVYEKGQAVVRQGV